MAARVIIKGGTVVDGTGAPGRVADVAIEGDRQIGMDGAEPRDGEIDIGGRKLDRPHQAPACRPRHDYR